jgi:hypothetical protein
MRQEITQEVIKATPPAVVAGAGHLLGLTLNEWVLVATLVYVGLQTAHLLWKWWREAKGRRK